MVKLKKAGGAPKNASYVTVSAEAKLTDETLHENIAEANKHTPKIHATSHEPGGSDEVTGITPGAHKTSHEEGGSDEVTPALHALRHQNGGADEINVAGLSGELADNQPPKAHASAHQNGGSDEISVAGLSGELADNQPPKAHKTSHQNGGADEISVAGLSGELADNQPPKAHASSHEGGADALTLTSIDSLACRIKTGQYTGDGTESQGITGIGFQPKYVIVHQHRTSASDTYYFWKHAQDEAALSTRITSAPSFLSGKANMIISLDADGFTVDDAGIDDAPNADGVTYDYVALG